MKFQDYFQSHHLPQFHPSREWGGGTKLKWTNLSIILNTVHKQMDVINISAILPDQAMRGEKQKHPQSLHER